MFLLPWKGNNRSIFIVVGVDVPANNIKVFLLPWKGNNTFLFIVGVHVPAKNIKVLLVAMERQQWVLFAMFSTYNVVHTDIDNKSLQILLVCVRVLASVIR